MGEKDPTSILFWAWIVAAYISVRIGTRWRKEVRLGGRIIKEATIIPKDKAAKELEAGSE